MTHFSTAACRLALAAAVLACFSRWPRASYAMDGDFAEDYEELYEEEELSHPNVATTAMPNFSDTSIMDLYDMRQLRGSSDQAFAKLAQGKYILFYIPGMLHCDYARYQIQNDDDDGTWRELACSEAEKAGWMWAYPIDPERWNLYRVFDKLTNAPILYDQIYSLPEMSPRAKVVQYANGPGWVYLWVRPPREPYPNLVGFKVTMRDDMWRPGYWKEIPEFGRVRFYGKEAKVFPIDPCPDFPESNMFCMMITDEISYVPQFLDENQQPIHMGTMLLHIIIQTFRFPYPPYARKYSHHYDLSIVHNDCKIFKDCPPLDGVLPGKADLPQGLPDVSMDLMFDEYFATDLPPPEYKGCTVDDLWIIFLCLCLFVLLVLVPIIFFIATRAGHREADVLWVSWAEGPGNVGIGLGYTAIAWEGKRPPWRSEERAQKEKANG